MKQPEKWKETVDPFSISFNNFEIMEVLGYPHAQNDVFYVKGKCLGGEVFAFVKYASKMSSNIDREVRILQTLDFDFLPQILDFDLSGKFIVTKEVCGERLSYILQTTCGNSFEYMFNYGKVLAQIHSSVINVENVKHRKFFDAPTIDYLKEYDIEFVREYLQENKPSVINECFCHGDFHYANVLWKDKKLVAVLDWELAGIGNREFDIAWAIINRPSQKFLNTQEEVDEFLRGYKSVSECNEAFVKYYMVQIYAHFISVGKQNSEYVEFVKTWLYDNTRL